MLSDPARRLGSFPASSADTGIAAIARPGTPGNIRRVAGSNTTALSSILARHRRVARRDAGGDAAGWGQGVKPVRAITWADAGDREAVLVGQCIAGDDGACSRLVAEHQRMVYQLAFHLLADHNDALDLSQDVFLQVFRMLPRFRGQSTLKTWIYRIVVNQARNRQRWWRRRFRSAQVSLDQHVELHGDLPATSTANEPDRVLGRRELAQRLTAALLELPFDQRTALVLREMEGLSYEEIAFSQGVAVGTVKSRLARARELLRAELRESPAPGATGVDASLDAARLEGGRP